MNERLKRLMELREKAYTKRSMNYEYDFCQACMNELPALAKEWEEMKNTTPEPSREREELMAVCIEGLREWGKHHTIEDSESPCLHSGCEITFGRELADAILTAYEVRRKNDN